MSRTKKKKKKGEEEKGGGGGGGGGGRGGGHKNRFEEEGRLGCDGGGAETEEEAAAAAGAATTAGRGCDDANLLPLPPFSFSSPSISLPLFLSSLVASNYQSRREHVTRTRFASRVAESSPSEIGLDLARSGVDRLIYRRGFHFLGYLHRRSHFLRPDFQIPATPVTVSFLQSPHQTISL
ncbi:unnamed protein product [Camellia sinensis]